MKASTRVVALAVALTLAFAATACGSSSDDGGASGGSGTVQKAIDYASIGLWDDGPCDKSRPPLVVGLTTVFASPVLSLGDQALALEASAKAFNARGGANGACIEVHTCDDGGTADQSLECVRKIDEAGVVATINDTGTAGQAEVTTAMDDAHIPRVANNVTPEDWASPNVYPLDSSATGSTFLGPQALVEEGAKKIALVRVDQAAASALVGLLESLYGDDGVTFPVDVPVPAGTTDYSQFILAAQNAKADAIALALGDQEAIQVVNAGQQLATPLLIGAAPLSYSRIGSFGDFAKQLVFLSPVPPPTADVPVYAALRADLAASGKDGLQPDNLTTNVIKSWIGLYALLRAIRDAKLQDFTRESISGLLQTATNVAMLGMYGDESWTPNLNHPGAFKRAGIDRVAVYRWDQRRREMGSTATSSKPQRSASTRCSADRPSERPGPAEHHTERRLPD
jgi:ABC-type branched-subunit amino acid transport system substrate-binding protein